MGCRWRKGCRRCDRTGRKQFLLARKRREKRSAKLPLSMQYRSSKQAMFKSLPSLGATWRLDRKGCKTRSPDASTRSRGTAAPTTMLSADGGSRGNPGVANHGRWCKKRERDATYANQRTSGIRPSRELICFSWHRITWHTQKIKVLYQYVYIIKILNLSIVANSTNWNK